MKRSVVLATALLLVMNLAGPAMAKNKFEKEVDKEADAVKLVHEVERGGYKVVQSDELKQWIDNQKDMIIVDTMPYEASYKKGHLPGAVQFLFPIPDMTTWDTKETDGKSQADFEALLGADKNKTIVIYCGFVKCTRSHNGAAWAKSWAIKMSCGTPAAFLPGRGPITRWKR